MRGKMKVKINGVPDKTKKGAEKGYSRNKHKRNKK